MRCATESTVFANISVHDIMNLDINSVLKREILSLNAEERAELLVMLRAARTLKQ